MGYYNPDVYSQPEAFDLVPVAELEMSEPNYDFDIVMVWQHRDGVVYWARDSGCSCPSPFEEFTSLEDLSLLFPDETYDQFVKYVSDSYDAQERARFLRKVRDVLKKVG